MHSIHQSVLLITVMKMMKIGQLRSETSDLHYQAAETKEVFGLLCPVAAVIRND